MSRLVNTASKLTPQLLTWGLVIAGAISALLLYAQWTSRPWTRDAQVRATIIKITPQVNGNVVSVFVRDNEFVHKDDPLFEIDPDNYQLAVDQAKVALDQAREEVASLEAAVRVAEAQYRETQAKVASANRQISAAEAGVESAQASVDQASAGITTAEQLIVQRKAEVENAESEAKRAARLVDEKAGSVEDAESTAATATAKEAQLKSAEAGLLQAQATLKQATAGLREAQINLEIAEDSLREAQAAETSAQASWEQAQANLGVPGDENVRVRSAQVSLAEAELNLSRTRITAPCNGYISNLAIDEGTYAVVGQPLVAVVDSESFRVHAYFQENKLHNLKPNDQAVVTLMSHPDVKLVGIVEDIGSAVNPPNIAPTEGQPGEVPQIQPTFDWVRLPQRVPVTIKLDQLPEDVQLISGTTASVAVRSAPKE